MNAWWLCIPDLKNILKNLATHRELLFGIHAKRSQPDLRITGMSVSLHRAETPRRPIKWLFDLCRGQIDVGESRARRPVLSPAGRHVHAVHIPLSAGAAPGHVCPSVASVDRGLAISGYSDHHHTLHHHNILRSGDRFLAIDAKAMLGEPEYDVASFLWNPLGTTMQLDVTERRLAAFAAAGLDQERMRAWAVIRAAYLGSDGTEERVLRALVEG